MVLKRKNLSCVTISIFFSATNRNFCKIWIPQLKSHFWNCIMTDFLTGYFICLMWIFTSGKKSYNKIYKLSHRLIWSELVNIVQYDATTYLNLVQCRFFFCKNIGHNEDYSNRSKTAWLLVCVYGMFEIWFQSFSPDNDHNWICKLIIEKFYQ